MSAGLERLRDLAPPQDEALAALDHDEARARFVRSAAVRRRLPRRAAWIAAAAVAVAAAILFVLWPSRALTFAVGTADGRIGAWIAAGIEDPVPVRFSDGTSLTLQPGGRARVASSDDRGARVLLESGAIHASVVHRAATSWAFDAGPFVVQVTGTQFDIAWDPTKQDLRLTLREGAVYITGACLPEPRTVAAGETLRVSCKEQRVVLEHGAEADGAAPEPPSPASAREIVTAAPLVPAVPPSTSASALSVPRSTWRELMAKDRYGEAMDAAEAEGFDGLVARASAVDLLALADVARFSGRGARALQALHAVRSRFGGSGEAARAAFHLGRIAFDQRGAHGEAATWFATYLAEQPGGALAQEALGRIVECREAMGQLGEAREAARRYLASYPNGPHAERAKSLLAGE